MTPARVALVALIAARVPGDALREELPVLLAYVLSFVYLGISPTWPTTASPLGRRWPATRPDWPPS